MGTGYKRFAVSTALVIGVLLVALINLVGDTDPMFINGPLSKPHQELSNACDRCHTPYEGVTARACLECHDTQNPKTHLAGKTTDNNLPACTDCHHEHLGEFRNLAQVDERQCIVCHTMDLHDDPKKNRTRSVSLSHKTYYEKATLDKKTCTGCHKPDEIKQLDRRHKYTKYLAHTHMQDGSMVCTDCHEPFVINGFDISGGGVVIRRCYDCHNEKLVRNECAACHRFHPRTSYKS